MQQTIKKWELKEIIFDTCIVQAILYGVEVWGASTSASTWNDIEKIQKSFLCKHLGVKKTTPYSILLLETGCRPLEIRALKRMFAYIMKIKLMPANRIPSIAWIAGSAPQKTKKSKFLSSSLLQEVRKWFTKWRVEKFMDMQIIKGKETAYMLDFETTLLNTLHAGWKSAIHKSKFDYYCQRVNKSYWTQYIAQTPAAQVHIRTPMPYKARRAISIMRTRSHVLKIETGGWLKLNASERVCKFCNMNAIEDEEHVTMICPAYEHVRGSFPQLIADCHSFEDLLSRTDPSPTALGTFFAHLLSYHNKLLELHDPPPKGD